MYDFGRVLVDFINFYVVEFDVIDNVNNFAAGLIKFLEIGGLFNQFAPKLFVKLCRSKHCFFTKRDVIIKPNDFNEITLLIRFVFKFVFYDLLEAIDDKLLYEGRG